VNDVADTPHDLGRSPGVADVAENKFDTVDAFPLGSTRRPADQGTDGDAMLAQRPKRYWHR
jgi:hypothetical protein